jgi:hypothetical protein
MSHETSLTEKQQYWLTHIRACEQSGMTMKAYAKENSLNVGALYAWKKTLRRKGVIEGPESDAKPLFRKATVSDYNHGRARLLHPCGLVLEIDVGTDPHWVVSLLKAMP